jgi:hypothetical protein
VKIGHEKEFRYDILARIIPVYEELKRHANEISELEKSENKNQDLIELSLYLAYWHNYPAEYHALPDLFGQIDQYKFYKKELDDKIKAKKQERGKAKTKAEIETIQKELNELTLKANSLKGQMDEVAKKTVIGKVFKANDYNIKQLGLASDPINTSAKWRNIGKSLAEEEWFKKLDLPKFHYPENITSLSFEIEKEGEKEKLGSKEPYSSYVFKGAETPIEANQVIASTNPMSAAKLLVLSADKQREYYKKVLKPLLVNFYIATSKNKNEALEKMKNDLKGINTISEIIHLIQEKIIAPIEGDRRLLRDMPRREVDDDDDFHSPYDTGHAYII